MHEEDSQFPEYLEGYNSDPEETNPYEYINHVGYQLLEYSQKKVLTIDDKKDMRSLHKTLENSSWHKWARGQHRKKAYDFL